MIEAHPTIHQSILAQMTDGVLTLDLSGRIVTCNAAAGRILGLDPAAVIGRTYAEVFFADSANEPLNELVLRAIHEAQTTHSEEIALPVAGHVRHLALSTTFLHGPDAGEPERQGVIVVLSDITEKKRRKRIQRLFGTYVDPRIVEQLVLDPAALAEHGARRTMTVLFTDLEDFTGLSECLPADQLVSVLNTYLGVMSRPISELGGITDKYIGDAIMASWGPPFTAAEAHPCLACAAALAQRARLPELRATLARRFGEHERFARLDMRAGIATGEMVVGNVGPDHARNYTTIGGAVNFAARLQEANKLLGTRILVGEATRQQAGDVFRFRALEPIRLRGRLCAEPVFELLAAEGASPAASA